MQFRLQGWLQQTDNLAVDVVHRCREKQQRTNEPAVVAHPGRCGRDRGSHDSTRCLLYFCQTTSPGGERFRTQLPVAERRRAGAIAADTEIRVEPKVLD